MAEDKFPDVDDPATAPFWDGTRQGRIVVPFCTDCGYLRWPPGPFCTECLSRNTEWKEISPTGTLWSYAIYHRAMSPKYADEIPYMVALVELDDGPRMYGRLLAGAANVEVGVPVRAVFHEIEPGVSVVNWEVATDVGRGKR